MKTMKYFSMAALAFVGAVMTSCSSDDLTENTQQSAENSGNNVEILTASVSMAGGETRALTDGGVKTFAEGDKMAVVYQNTSGKTVKAESNALAAGDITNGGKSASFTVTLTNADKTKNVTYIYPASMANNDGSVNYDALAEQDGTLESLATNLDYCEYSGAWNGSNLPTGDMSNQLVVCAYTLKNSDGSVDITSNVTTMTVSDGTNVYIVNRAAAAGPIYVAILPTDNKNIKYTAIANSKVYTKNVADKTYAKGKWFPLGLRMTQNDNIIPGLFTVKGQKVYFSKGNLRASKKEGVWSWRFAPNQWSIVGNNSANINITGNGTLDVSSDYLYVDLFGWSTSTTHLGIHNSTNNNDYRGADFADWGSADEVIAGIGTGWRTPTSDDWRYLLVNRTTASTKHYCKAQVDGHPGVILIPDNWSTTYGLEKCDVVEISFNASNIDKVTLEDWNSTFAPNGAVFLPTTGQRENKTVSYENGRLYYWSSTSGANTSGESANANQMYIAGNSVAPDTGAGRHFGNAVRLVYNIK